jgi:20S proteasome alpha/beta subunit
MSLIIAVKVPTGIVLASDSRSTVSRGQGPLTFDRDRKLFVVPDAPVLVALYAETRAGVTHASDLLRSAVSSGSSTPVDVAARLADALNRSSSRPPAVRAVVAGCGPAPAVWTVQPDGEAWRALEVLPSVGMFWAGTTDVLDRLMGTASTDAQEAIIALAERIARRSLSAEERELLLAPLAPRQIDYAALPLDEAADVVADLLHGAIAFHRLVDGANAPVGGDVVLGTVDAWGSRVRVRGPAWAT